MNFKELILRTFEKKKLDQIVWQPRIMLWYNGNMVSRISPRISKKYSALRIANLSDRDQFVPKEYIGKNIIEIYKDLNASIRYCAETLYLWVAYFSCPDHSFNCLVKQFVSTNHLFNFLN